MARLNINIDQTVHDPDYQVVRLDGEFDKSTAAEFGAQLVQCAAACRHRFLVFDLAKLSYINSEGIGLLVLCHTKLVTKRNELLLVAPQPNARDVMELVGVPKMMSIFSHMSDAIAYMKRKT